MNVLYHVELSQAERGELTTMLSKGKRAARKLKRAQILLAADAGSSDEEIARAVAVGGSTVYRTKRRFVEGKDGRPEQIIAKVSQETLAEMIGTTRSRVSHFMNKFRKLGFIEYNGHLEVHSSLLNVVLHDQPQISGVHAAEGSSDAKVA